MLFRSGAGSEEVIVRAVVMNGLSSGVRELCQFALEHAPRLLALRVGALAVAAGTAKVSRRH